METTRFWSHMARKGKETVATAKAGGDNEEEISEAAGPFLSLLGKGADFCLFAQRTI